LRQFVFLVLSLLLFVNSNCMAQSVPRTPWWSLDLPEEPVRPRSDFLAPFGSLLLPSFDQFWEGQTTAGGLYLTYTLVGFSQMTAAFTTTETETVFSSKDDRLRRAFLGAQMIQTAGSLSAYHSFRSAVESRRHLGEYGFLQNREDSADLMKAPFRFEFLTRTSTYAVLGVELLLLAIDFQQFQGRTQFTSADAGFTAGYSYQAGVGEEALFRGWMMPYLTNIGWAPWASNLLTATSFSLAHVSEPNPRPWPQFLLGWYLGQVSLWNDWSIQESIFIHTWWDVLAIGASWAMVKDQKEKAIFLPLIDLPISL
jgi:hypothetical protein